MERLSQRIERMFAPAADGLSAVSGSAGRAGAREQLLLAGQRLAGRRRYLDRDDLARLRQAREVHDLVVARATAQLGGIGPRAALDEHVERPPHEAPRALVCAALDDLHQPLHPLAADLMRNSLRQL